MRILATIGVLFVVGVTFVVLHTAPYRELNAWNLDVISQLELAKGDPPSGATKDQWETIVAWTQTAFPNVFFTPESIIDDSEFIAFKHELSTRLDGEIDLETIAWIWDEFADIGKSGVHYASEYRPVAPFGRNHLDESGQPFESVDVSTLNRTE